MPHAATVPTTADLSTIESILHMAEGELALGAVIDGRRLVYRVFWWTAGRQYIGRGKNLDEALAKAAGSRAQQKKCSRCDRRKPLDEFPRRKDVRDGRASQCLVCDRARKKKWYPRACRPHPIRAAGSLALAGQLCRRRVRPEVA